MNAPVGLSLIHISTKSVCIIAKAPQARACGAFAVPASPAGHFSVSYTHLDVYKRQGLAFPVFNVFSKQLSMDSHENRLDHAPHELSGGQKQRVSLAGVMVDQVKILMFDEPLASLDPATGKQAICLLYTSCQRKTEKPELRCSPCDQHRCAGTLCYAAVPGGHPCNRLSV